MALCFEDAESKNQVGVRNSLKIQKRPRLTIQLKKLELVNHYGSSYNHLASSDFYIAWVKSIVELIEVSFSINQGNKACQPFLLQITISNLMRLER